MLACILNFLKANKILFSIFTFLYLHSLLALPCLGQNLGLEQTVDLMARAMLRRWNGISTPRDKPQILFGIGGTSVYGGCRNQASDVIPGSFYCEKTNTIILEINELELLRQRLGPGAVAYALAHEFAHWVQSLENFRLPNPANELQADCIAGYMVYGVRNDIGVDNKDVREMLATAYSVGGGDHGSPEQRAYWLSTGLKGNFSGCYPYRKR